METTVAERLRNLWKTLYGNNANYSEELLNEFIRKIDIASDSILQQKRKQPQHEEDEPKKELFHVKSADWYQKAVVYCLYVDLFSSDFAGLEEKLVYLQQLGVTCLWLLPILDSPMKDCGFDIRDYGKVRKELLPQSVRESSVEEQFAYFRKFMAKAHSLGINVLIDVALNHTSEENEWFVTEKTKKADGAPIDTENDYYIWSETDDKYNQVRIIFSDVCDSNWEPVHGESTDQRYYFHRFLANQPDLNYRNPKVLLEIASAFVFWLQQGVDAFRVDAAPMLWKEEGTECESLPQVHQVIKFFRTVIDHVSPHTAILAEACQQPQQVVKYFGENDECNAAYHFPLIPRLFHSFAIQDKAPVQQILSKAVTPDIPAHCAWFLFLRCHDELTLEMVPEEERRQIFDFYCHDEKWQFRQHSGVSARLADLCKMNPDWIKMAHSLLLTIIGTPILFYGDEFAMQNDEEYYEESLIVNGGIHDSRNYNRGRLNTKWAKVEEEIKNETSLAAIVHHDLKQKLKVRHEFEWLGKTTDVRILDLNDVHGNPKNCILAYERVYNDEGLLIVHNLSDKPCDVVLPYNFATEQDLLGKPLHVDNGNMTLQPYGHLWLRLDRKTNSVV